MAETLLSRFFGNADRLGSRPSTIFPVGGETVRWVPAGWRSVARLVRDLAAGILELGGGDGKTLAILSQTRREWLMTDLANLAARGLTVGVYPTMTADQTKYVLGHSDAKIVVVEDAKQLAKVQSVRAGLPALETIVVVDPSGVTISPKIVALADVIDRGRKAKHDIAKRIAAIKLEDAAIFIYTSGTTGPPKGAVLTHGNLVGALEAISAVPLVEGDVGFSFLPLAHSLQRLADYRALWSGIPGWYGRAIDTVADDLAVASPTVMASVPRIFEKIYAKINETAAASGPRKKMIFDWAVRIGREAARLRRDGQALPTRLESQLQLARLLVYDKLRARLGGKVRLFFTGGAPIAAEILEFFEAAGIQILEAWGMTETFAAGSLNLPDAKKIGTIGRPLPGITMKLDVDGEILIKGPNVFSGYYKDDEATQASFTSDGFFKTGDIGTVDADGFFKIVDRKKDLIITAAGKNIAPQNIENLIKTDPRISQVMAVGDRRPYLVALVSVDNDLLKAKPEAEVVKMIDEIIARKNEELAPYERIKKFRLLPQDLTQESGDLTPSLKVKRKVVGEKYKKLIDDMYA